jgi:hypothetical protein
MARLAHSIHEPTYQRVVGRQTSIEESPIASFAAPNISTQHPPRTIQTLPVSTQNLSRWGKSLISLRLTCRDRAMAPGSPSIPHHTMRSCSNPTVSLDHGPLTRCVPSLIDAPNKVPQHQKFYQQSYAQHTRLWKIVRYAAPGPEGLPKYSKEAAS